MGEIIQSSPAMAEMRRDRGLWFGHESPQKLASRRDEDKNIVLAVNGARRWSPKVAGDVELNLRRGVDLQWEEEEDFFFCFPPEAISRAGLAPRPSCWAGSVGFGQVSPFCFFFVLFLFLFSVFQIWILFEFVFCFCRFKTWEFFLNMFKYSPATHRISRKVLLAHEIL
jgi:hypothetical protein